MLSQMKTCPPRAIPARELVQADPTSMAYRVTLALAELRLHHTLAALDAFSGVEPGRTVSFLPRQGGGLRGGIMGDKL